MEHLIASPFPYEKSSGFPLPLIAQPIMCIIIWALYERLPLWGGIIDNMS